MTHASHMGEAHRWRSIAAGPTAVTAAAQRTPGENFCTGFSVTAVRQLSRGRSVVFRHRFARFPLQSLAFYSLLCCMCPLRGLFPTDPPRLQRYTMADEFVTPNPPAPWTRVLDESTGCYYYFNTRSGESVWETPAVVTAVLEGFEPNTAVEPAGDDSGAAAASGAGTDEYSDVIDTVVADLTVDAPRPGEEDLPTSFHGHRSSVAILLTPDGTATPAKRKPAPSNSTSNDSSAAAVGKGGGDAAASSEELPGPPDADSATPRARTLTVNTTPAPAPVQKKSFISRLMQKLRITKPDSPGVAAGGAGGNAAVTFGNVVASACVQPAAPVRTQLVSPWVCLSCGPCLQAMARRFTPQITRLCTEHRPSSRLPLSGTCCCYGRRRLCYLFRSSVLCACHPPHRCFHGSCSRRQLNLRVSSRLLALKARYPLHRFHFNYHVL